MKYIKAAIILITLIYPQTLKAASFERHQVIGMNFQNNIVATLTKWKPESSPVEICEVNIYDLRDFNKLIRKITRQYNPELYDYDKDPCDMALRGANPYFHQYALKKMENITLFQSPQAKFSDEDTVELKLPANSLSKQGLLLKDPHLYLHKKRTHARKECPKSLKTFDLSVSQTDTETYLHQEQGLSETRSFYCPSNYDFASVHFLNAHPESGTIQVLITIRMETKNDTLELIIIPTTLKVNAFLNILG